MGNQNCHLRQVYIFLVLWFFSYSICVDYQITGFLLDAFNLPQATSAEDSPPGREFVMSFSKSE